MEITAIAKQYGNDGDEKFDIMEWTASASTFGELSVSGVRDMVRKVMTVSNYRKITKLNWVDHGPPSASYIRLGKDKITTANIEKYRAPLEQLSEKFSSKGLVHIQNCYAGRNAGLLKQFAKILLVPVYAGTEKHVPCFGWQFGDYVVARPKGNPETVVSVPSGS